MKKSICDFWFQFQSKKTLDVVTPGLTPRKKVEYVEIQLLFFSSTETCDSHGNSPPPNSRKTGEYRGSLQRCAYSQQKLLEP